MVMIAVQAMIKGLRNGRSNGENGSSGSSKEDGDSISVVVMLDQKCLMEAKRVYPKDFEVEWGFIFSEPLAPPGAVF